MRDLNFLPKVWYALAGFDNPTFISSVGKMANGGILRGLTSPRLPKPITQKVSKLLMEKYGIEISMETSVGFVTPFVIADAINRAGSLDKEAIVAALEKTNIPGDQMVMPGDGVRFSPCAPPQKTVTTIRRHRISLCRYRTRRWKLFGPSDCQRQNRSTRYSPIICGSKDYVNGFFAAARQAWH